MDKIGNLVRLLEKPDGLEDFSILEWFLIVNASPDLFQIKRKTGVSLFVKPSEMGKEYDFREFELSDAKSLAEHLVLLNLKLDIQNAPVPYVQQQPHYTTAYPIPTPIPYGFTSSGTVTAPTITYTAPSTTSGLSSRPAGIKTSTHHTTSTNAIQQMQSDQLEVQASVLSNAWHKLVGK